MKNDLNPRIDSERLHSVKDVAKLLGLSDRTVYLWIESGRLGHYRIASRTIRIGEHHLRKFLRETENEFQRACERERESLRAEFGRARFPVEYEV